MSVQRSLNMLTIVLVVGSATSCSDGTGTMVGPDEPVAYAVHGEIRAPYDLAAEAGSDGIIRIWWEWGDHDHWDLVSFTPVVDGEEGAFTEETNLKPYDVDHDVGQWGIVEGARATGEHEVCIEAMAKNFSPPGEAATTYHSVACTTVQAPLRPPTLEVDLAPDKPWVIYLDITWSDDQSWDGLLFAVDIDGQPTQVRHDYGPYEAGTVAQWLDAPVHDLAPGPHELCAWVLVETWEGGVLQELLISESTCVNVDTSVGS